jgi:acyl-CoA reductase-like NAD-dependent aldehyde dehydrogenase
MLHLPALRWGEPYKSLDVDQVAHFETGEPLAEISRVNGGLVDRDLRRIRRAREALREISVTELLAMLKRAADSYLDGELPLGDGVLTAEQFVALQSATTGLPHILCRANMTKIHFVLSNLDKILAALTRDLPMDFLGRGYGVEERGVPVSLQAQSPVLGLVLPSNSPGVHTLWLPAIPLQVGLVLKPGTQEPWTPYRIVQAMIQAGVPRQAISIYAGGHDVGAAVLNGCPRAMIFGGQQTVEQYKSNPGVQVHGPGFSKILLGDDEADHWERYLDLMVESVLLNGGRSCINASAIWTPRHARAIAEALAERLGPIQPTPPDDPRAALAAFIVPSVAEAVSADIDEGLKSAGAHDLTAKFGPRLVRGERHAYLRPTVVLCESPELDLARKEYMFPFVSVVVCPQGKMLEQIGPTLVCTALTKDALFQRTLLDSPRIDRLNIGPVPTTRLNWLQPHEGNIVDFLFRSRAFQFDPDFVKV